MPLDRYRTQVLLLHSEQSALDSLSSGFDDRYTVHCASSGTEALTTLGETPIDVIVSAQDLPGMSGIEALREAKKRSPETIGILLAGTDEKDVQALVGDKEVFQVVTGKVTGEGLLELVEDATRQMRLAALAESANDTAANPDDPADEHIVMETSGNGSTIISDGTGRLPAPDPEAVAAVGAQSVDVLVLTRDREFLTTIRESSRGMHTVHYANTLKQADETIRKHTVGVAVVDAAMVGDRAEQLTRHLRRGAPRLVSVVAGRRDDGEMLMDLINRGKVYRFLLKPVSPGRARLAVEASVRHHLEAPEAAFEAKEAPAKTATGKPKRVGKAASGPVDAPPGDPSPDSQADDGLPDAVAGGPPFTDPKLIGIAGAAVVAVAAGLFWFLGGDDGIAPLAEPAAPASTPSVTEADVVPDDLPDDAIVAAEPDAVIGKALGMAETALLESRADDAAAALRHVALAEPENSRLAFLTAQLEQLRLRGHLAEARAAIRDTRFEDAGNALAAARALGVADVSEVELVDEELNAARRKQRIDELLALAAARLEEGSLLNPPEDNARHYYDLVLANDPADGTARQGLNVIAGRLVLQARSEIDNGELDAAGGLLEDARAIDASGEELAGAAAALTAAHDAVAARERRAAERRAEAERRAALKAEPGTPLDVRDRSPVGISALTRTRYVAPEYPHGARRRSQSGWVDIAFTVALDGSVKDIDVRAAEPADVFDSAAVHAVERWEFEPVTENGVTVEKRAAVRMLFALE
ncbi:MAG: TonB family protein [Proteobacteria bacterium]|nr:TonB family protein [Pseudomonadota bacterium]